MKKMRFISVTAFIVAIAVTAMLNSCKKISEELKYDLPLQIGNEEIIVLAPTSDTTAEHIIGSGTNSCNIDSFVRANTKNVLGVNNINSVKLTACTVFIHNGSTINNFANLESCYTSFYSTGNTTPFQVVLASNPATYSTVLNLPVDPTINLKSYIKGNDFFYNIGAKLRKPITDSLRCTIEYTFSVNVLG